MSYGVLKFCSDCFIAYAFTGLKPMELPPGNRTALKASKLHGGFVKHTFKLLQLMFY